jgi:hypothetical protein
MTEKWLSIVEYARIYNVSDMTVRRRIKTGKLHAVLQEGKYFIPIPGKDEAKPAPQPPAPRRPGAEMQVIKGHPSPQRTFAAPPQHAVSQHRQAPSASYEQAPQIAQQRPVQPRQVGMPQAEPAFDAEHYPFRSFDDDESDGALIPAGLRRAVTSGDTAVVDARALLTFCEAAMKKIQESERRQVERFKSKLEALEATVAARDGEIKTLKQNLEDLQLLAKVLERKRPSA